MTVPSAKEVEHNSTNLTSPFLGFTKTEQRSPGRSRRRDQKARSAPFLAYLAVKYTFTCGANFAREKDKGLFRFRNSGLSMSRTYLLLNKVFAAGRPRRIKKRDIIIRNFELRP
jgi:hypothetical protein